LTTDEQISKCKHKKYEKEREYDTPKGQQLKMKDLTDSKGDKISISEIKRVMIRMISEMRKTY
jgi:hypothetical protein